MKLSEMLNSNYLKQSDIGEDTPTVTIESVKKVNMARPGDAPEYKIAVKFEEFERPLAANTTNLKRIAKAHGDDSELWLGKQMQLYVDAEVEFGGEQVGGLRVRALPRARPNVKPRQPSVDDINRDFAHAAADEPPPF